MQRHPVVGLEGDKQQGHKVVYNGLHNIADKTGIHGLLIGLFHLFLLDEQRTAGRNPVYYSTATGLLQVAVDKGPLFCL